MGEIFVPSSFDSHEDELAFLKQLGFATNPLNTTVGSVQEAWEYAEKIEHNRGTLEYGIDGVVVKLERNDLARQLQVVGKTPRAWAAIKFAPHQVTTRVQDVVWQVGRTGKVTPIVLLEPVFLDGSVVQRATLHNAKECATIGLHMHDRVVIRKAGDIIPEVVTVLSNLREASAAPIMIPTHCPSCNQPLKYSKTGVDLVCLNAEHCTAQIVARLSYFAGKSIANITGLSQKTIEKWVAELGVHDIADLYDLPYAEIGAMEGFGEKAVQNLQKAIERARQLPDYKLLAGLGIDGVGVEVAKTLCQLLTKRRQANKTNISI
jgi:DNA ligase (NAD+)